MVCMDMVVRVYQLDSCHDELLLKETDARDPAADHP